MSLIITSNTALAGQEFSDVGLNKPSSYVNQINGTLEIPAFSQIAVQSIKITKTGNVVIPQGGLNFGFYFGRAFNYNTSNDYLVQPSFMTPTSVGESGESLSVEQLAEKTKIALNNNLWHPNLLLNASTGRNPGASCEVKRNASNDLVGFEFEVTNSASSNNENNIPTSDFWIKSEFTEDTHTFIGTELASSPTNQFPLTIIGASLPLSLAGGEFNCSLGNSSKLEWSVGLSRSTRPDFDYQPSYFDDYNGDFFDYVVKQELEGASHLIRAYHCITCGATSELCTEMVEINYGTILDGIVETIHAVQWEVDGERVSCKLTKTNGSILTLFTGTSATSASNAKPINMMCRFLYPKITLEPGKNVKIIKWDGVKVKDFIYGGVAPGGTIAAGPYLYHDYWAYLENTGQVMDIAFDFELRNPINGFPVANFINQIGLSAGKINYPTNGILLGFGKYKGVDSLGLDTGFTFSSSLNSYKIYGFTDRIIAPTISLTNPLTWISNEPPVIKNTNSLFVRLKNMTFDSANFSMSNMSKILYHIPAFSNNGESTGSLFFEPEERVYLDLHNTQESFITTMEVDIVNADERITKDLLGKTVVVFHVRPSKR